jgi:signal transduction histidine kinase
MPGAAPALIGALAVAVALALRVHALRRRLELVARAEHEIRGPAAALLLALERMCREPAAHRHARLVELELTRLRAALADLAAAREGRLGAERPERLRLDDLVGGAPRAAVRADRGRVAQALGNLIDNAAEHGEGAVDIEARPAGRALRLVVSNGVRRSGPPSAPGPGRGRGLRIARDAAERAGGRLEVVREGERVSAALELPLAGDEPPGAA